MKIRPDIWLLGVPLLLAIWGVSVWRLAPEIESQLRREMQADTVRAGESALDRAGARVEVDGRDLTVTTDAPLGTGPREEAGRILRSVAGLRGPTYRVLPPAATQSFTFSVTGTRQGLVLSGFVPPGPFRPELLDLARERGGDVRDDLRSAIGAPEGFEDAARLLVRAVRRLEGASGSIADRKLSVAGNAPDVESYREAMSLLRALPPGYAAGTIEIGPPLVQPYSWSAVRESGGALVLAGHVPSETERQILLAAARDANPGLTIEDRMEAARGLESGIDFVGLGKRVLGVLGQLESGRADLRGRAMSIEGRLAARDLLESLRADLRTARLPGIDLERLELQPVVPRPYRLTARRRDGRLFLAGFLATESDRAAIRELVQRRFPFDALADDLHLADGAPEGLLPAGRLALERLAALAEGEARIEDRTIRLSGRSLYAELAGRIRRDFGTGLPAGWTGSAEIAAAPDKPLDPDFCGDLVSDAARREPVRFEPGKAELGPAALKAIAALADIMRRCGSARLMVDSTGEAEPARALAERRAGEVVAALAQHGVKAGVQTGAGKAAVAAKAPDEIAFEVSP